MAMALSAAQLAEFEERGFVTVGTPPPARISHGLTFTVIARR
jgi:hypothetical protein